MTSETWEGVCLPHLLKNLHNAINAEPEQIRRMCAEYQTKRTGTYEFRCRRYKAVTSKLWAMGLRLGDTIVDIGAGMCEFDHYLRTTERWSGIYQPIDGVVDGTNLEMWRPKCHAHFFTCIETIEHLNDPDRMLRIMERFATKGAVLTTPNAQVVDVLGMDETHLHAFVYHDFFDRGWEVTEQNLFGSEGDTLVAWRVAKKGDT